MTYQTSAQDFDASTAARGTNIFSATVNFARRAISAVGGLLMRIAEGYYKTAFASSRLQVVQMLNAKSDAELADLGIKREDIVHHVFRDLYHI